MYSHPFGSAGQERDAEAHVTNRLDAEGDLGRDRPRPVRFHRPVERRVGLGGEVQPADEDLEEPLRPGAGPVPSPQRSCDG